MVTKEIPINHEILSWARQEANLSLERAAEKAKISEIKQKGTDIVLPPSVRLEQWEHNVSTPTYNQLVKLAKAYRRPVLTFFLRTPPKKEVALIDFRTLVNKEEEIQEHEAEFSALVRQIKAIQVSVKEIIESTEVKPLTFVGSVSPDRDPREVATTIRETLGFEPVQQTRIRTVHNLFSYIRNLAENLGIYVILQGNLGNYYTNLSNSVFRGFTLADSFAPFIVVNPNDTKTANVFTLVHELCHIWFGDTGVSNWNSLNLQDELPNIAKENFCDSVTAEFLVPRGELFSRLETFSSRISPEQTIDRLASYFKVSRIVIARRLLTFEQITTEEYWDWYDQYQEEWLRLREILKTRKEEEQENNGPGYRVLTRNKLGGALISTILDAAREGKISDLDAASILNVKINNFSKIY